MTRKIALIAAMALMGAATLSCNSVSAGARRYS